LKLAEAAREGIYHTVVSQKVALKPGWNQLFVRGYKLGYNLCFGAAVKADPAMLWRLRLQKVFAERLNLVSGLEVGFGGVFVGAAPHCLFIPDRDGNDVPDGPPEISRSAIWRRSADVSFASSSMISAVLIYTL